MQSMWNVWKAIAILLHNCQKCGVNSHKTLLCIHACGYYQGKMPL